MENKGGYPDSQPPPTYESATQPNNAYPMHAYNKPPQVIDQLNNVYRAPPPQTVAAQEDVFVIIGQKPIKVACHLCHVSKVTRIDYETSASTHWCAVLFCLISLGSCFYLPYFGIDTKNATHYCSHCGAYIATYLHY